MNIFVLMLDPEECAKHHCDKHVVKMILETAQILCAVHYITESPHPPPYKKTHSKHPCVLWTAESLDNYLWLVALGRALAAEYVFRYSTQEKPKSHKSLQVIEWAAAHLPPLEAKGVTTRPQAMPDHYRVDGDPVSAYRAYYMGEKAELLTYTRREVPNWLRVFVE